MKTLSEKQENLYEILNLAIDKFSAGLTTFENELSTINHYFKNYEFYGKSSAEVYVLNFKKAYRNFINLT